MFDVRSVGIVHQADHVIVEHAKPTREMPPVQCTIQYDLKETKEMVVVASEVGEK